MVVKVGGMCWVIRHRKTVNHRTDLGDQLNQRLRTPVDEPISSTFGGTGRTGRRTSCTGACAPRPPARGLS